MNARIAFTTPGGQTVFSDEVLSFSFRKDVYSAYTSLYVSAVFQELDPASVSEARFYLGSGLLHLGLIDSLKVVRSGGKNIVSLSSRGFTSQLCQNQLEPGPVFNVSFNDLMDDYYSFPNVTHENNSDASNYIYVEKRTTMWENVANLAYKLSGGYPFIRGDNCVRITPVPDPRSFSYPASSLLTIGSEAVGKRLVSHFHMADMGGTYGVYDYVDAEVSAMGIVRNSYFDLDMQFLRDPADALPYHDLLARRGMRRVFCSYPDYNGEDLSDLVSFGDVSNDRLSTLKITGSNGGVVTELGVYRDGLPV